MEFGDVLAAIKVEWRQKSYAFLDGAKGQALAFLSEDIKDSRLTNPPAHQDAFMLRANQIGIALLEEGFFSAAESLFRSMAAETLAFREETREWRHAGALLANTGAACAAQGNFDKAVIELLKAAEDDKVTYGIQRCDSFAITDLLQEYFGKPVRNTVLTVVQQVNPSVTLNDVEGLGGALGASEYAFLSYVFLAATHLDAIRIMPNDFSHFQTLTALRSLSVLLEVVLKTLAKKPDVTFFPAIVALYGRKAWWAAFESARRGVGATSDSIVPVDQRLRDALGLSTTDSISLFWKSLLTAYITRNYTTHQIGLSGAFVQHLQEVLGHVLNVMATASAHV